MFRFNVQALYLKKPWWTKLCEWSSYADHRVIVCLGLRMIYTNHSRNAECLLTHSTLLCL